MSGRSLLRHCVTYGAAVYYMRGGTPEAAYASFDDVVRSAVSRVLGGGVDDNAWARAQLPVRSGGLGFRSCAKHAAIAYAVAAADARRYVGDLCADPDGLPDDELLDRIIDASGAPPDADDDQDLFDEWQHLRDTTVNAIPEHVYQHVVDYIEGDAYEAHKQRELSQALEENELVSALKFAALELNNWTIEDAKRMVSCAGRHASAFWNAMPSTVDGVCLHMKTQHFLAITRARLGLSHNNKGSRTLCPHCRKVILGETASHVFGCTGDGNKAKTHNRVRDVIFTIAQGAGCSPVKETGSPFQHPTENLRCDILLQTPPDGNGPVALDLAVTSPLAATYERARADVLVALRAANKYADDKRKKYEQFLAPGTCRRFTPMIFESFGSMTDECRQMLCSIAVAYGNRRNMPPHRSIPMIMQRVSAALQQSLAETLVFDTEFDDGLVPELGPTAVAH
jgi:hypothetical protein